MRKGIIMFFCLSGLAFSAMAQQETSNFTATGSGLATTLSQDYESVGINPSNLGWDNPKPVHFGLLEGGYSIYSDALTKQDYTTNFLLSTNDSKLDSNGGQVNAALLMANKGYAINVDETFFGIAVQVPVVGGFGFTAKFRGDDYMHLNGTGADIIFNGSSAAYFKTAAANPENLSTLFDGSKIYMDAYMEYNLSYGRQLYRTDNLKIYGGVGIKYISSYAMMDFESKGGNLTGFAAFTPKVNVNYGASSPSSITSDNLTPIGSGFGYDIGGSVIIKDKLKVGVAVDDIGSVTYNGNVYQINDAKIKSTNSSGLQYFANYKDLNQLLGGEGIFKLQGLSSTTISLPTNFRIGGSYEVMKTLDLGVDFYLPLANVPGSLVSPEFSVGGQIKLVNAIKLSTGISVGGNTGFNVPLGIVFCPANGAYEFGVATRDILFLTSNTDPNASLLLGFMRFGI